MEGKKLYTTQEVAKELGVTDAYIRQLIARGKAQPATFGKMHMFTQEEVERLRNRPGAKAKAKKQ